MIGFGAVLEADSGKWKCGICSCKWDDDVLQCKSCEVGLKPGVSQADIDAKKKSLLDMFKAPVKDGPKPTGFGGFGSAPSTSAPTAFGFSAPAISFGFGSEGTGSSSGGISFGFGSEGIGSSSGDNSFGFGGGGDVAENVGSSSVGISFGFGSEGAGSSSSGSSFGFGSGGDAAKFGDSSSGGVAVGFGTGAGFVFNPSGPSAGDKNRELALKRKKKLAQASLPTADMEQCCHVYVMGNGECEQLGLGGDILERKKPHMISDMGFNKLQVLSVAVGGMHSIAVLANGQLYSWGCNDDGVLGRTGDENVPGLVSELQEQKVAMIACGDCHSAAVDTRGKMWLWGSYKDGGGHIGFPDFDASSRDPKTVSVTTPSGDKALKQPSPVAVPGLDKVVMLHCGANHTVIGEQTASGVELWSWGDNSVAQLGQGKRTPDPPTDADDAVREPKYKAWKRDKLKLLYPCRLDAGLPWLPGGRIAMVGGGHDCTFVMTAGQAGQPCETYCCGLNGDFQLGLGRNSEAEINWTNVPALSGVCLQTICGGASHTAALEPNGEVWCWGRAERSGHLQKSGSIETPKKIPKEAFAGLSIQKLKAGGTHTVACAENGDVFTWGTGETHQLGNVPRDVEEFTKEEKDCDEPPPELTPYLVTSGKLKDKFVVAAAGGAMHTVVLVWNGQVSSRKKRKNPPVAEGSGRPGKRPRLQILCKPALLQQCLKKLADAQELPMLPDSALEL